MARPRVILTDAPLAVCACEACGARIVYAHTERGKRVRVDVERSTRGNLVLYSESILGELVGGYRVRLADLEERAWLLGNLWVSHYSTCPVAAQRNQTAESTRGAR